MKMSLRGISNLPAAQCSGVNDSVESVLQWISFLQEEWLIVFDNADSPLLKWWKSSFLQVIREIF